MFEQTTCKRPASARTEITTGRTDRPSHGGRTKQNGVDVPREPWQVNVTSLLGYFINFNDAKLYSVILCIVI